ncbi:MAG: hypothetical protein WDO19_17270 [Bacteroidota bacterium]
MEIAINSRYIEFLNKHDFALNIKKGRQRLFCLPDVHQFRGGGGGGVGGLGGRSPVSPPVSAVE